LLLVIRVKYKEYCLIYQNRYTIKRTETLPISTSSSHTSNLLLRGVKLQHLRLIAQLNDTAQMSAAAAAINISQPAASRLAAELEQISGITLYTRHPRGVELTEHGRRFAMRAQSILQSLHDAGREIAELTSGHAGTVNIGAVTGPAIEMVLPVLKRMRITHPMVETSVIVDISDVVGQELLSHRIDFYIGRIPAHIDPRLFIASVISEEPASLIVREDHPLTRKPNISIADCLPYDWVMQTQEGLLNHAVEDYLITRGHRLPTKILSTSSLMLSLATITQTNSVAPVSRAVADFFSSETGLNGRIRSLPVAPGLTVSPYALIKLADSVLSPAAQIFFDYLTEQSAVTV
jgi:DNA-binding transcriptional LysR family regulator